MLPLLHPPASLPQIPTTLLPDNLPPVWFHDETFATALPSLEGSSMAIATTTADLSTLWSPETTLPPINPDSEAWIRSLVWTDFRVAVSLFVVVPLGLLGWAIVARIPPSRNTATAQDPRSPVAEIVLRYMTSYWQASSLLLLTVMLNICESPLGVLTGLWAQFLMVVSLYWWKDLNHELRQANTSPDAHPMARAFAAWRGIAGVAAATGVLIQLPFQGCLGASPSLSNDPLCSPWLEPPQFAAGLVGLEASPPLQLLANLGCALYALVLAYYITVLLPLVGRTGRAQRPRLMDVATPIGAWIGLGFLDPQQDDAAIHSDE